MKLHAPGVRGALQILDRTIDFMLRRNDLSRRRHVSRVNPLLDTLVNQDPCCCPPSEAQRQPGWGSQPDFLWTLMSLFGDKPEEEEE